MPPRGAGVRNRLDLLAPVHASPVRVDLVRHEHGRDKLIQPGHVDAEQTGRLCRADPIRGLRVEREPGARELQGQRLGVGGGGDPQASAPGDLRPSSLFFPTGPRNGPGSFLFGSKDTGRRRWPPPYPPARKESTLRHRAFSHTEISPQRGGRSSDLSVSYRQSGPMPPVFLAGGPGSSPTYVQSPGRWGCQTGRRQVDGDWRSTRPSPPSSRRSVLTWCSLRRDVDARSGGHVSCPALRARRLGGPGGASRRPHRTAPTKLHPARRRSAAKGVRELRRR